MARADQKLTYRLTRADVRPDELWLDYEWAELDNVEWRPCVEHFLNEVMQHGHAVASTFPAPPPFMEGEDFVDIVYLIEGVPTTFSSDHLLSLIKIKSRDLRVLRGVWNAIGDKMGWAR